MTSLLPIAIILILILLNGLFVAAEFAIVNVPPASIGRLAAQGHRTARLVRWILHDPGRQDSYIATAQLSITGASLELGMYGEHVIAERLTRLLESHVASAWIAVHGAANALSIVILTYFRIVLGEMVPKSLALLSAERTVLCSDIASDPQRPWLTIPVFGSKKCVSFSAFQENVH